MTTVKHCMGMEVVRQFLIRFIPDSELPHVVPNLQPSDLQCSAKAAKIYMYVSPSLHVDICESLHVHVSALEFTAVMERKVCCVACVKSMENQQQMPVEL